MFVAAANEQPLIPKPDRRSVHGQAGRALFLSTARWNFSIFAENTPRDLFGTPGFTRRIP